MDIMEQIKDEMRKVYTQTNKPICIAYSGGKDSSLLLTLLWEVLLEIPSEKRTKKVHVITSDTLLEVPVMTEYINRTLMKIERKSKQQQLPIEVHCVKPKLKSRYFVKSLGRGTLISTPNTKHRWCTHALKIEPTHSMLKELIASAPVTIGDDYSLSLWLGVRVEESARRAQSIATFQLSEESLWANHTDFKEIQVFHPIKFVTADELWFYLLEKGTLPYGVSVDELAIQYGEGILECGIKTSSDQGSACGGSNGRLGCWSCGMVSGNDPMLLRYIAEGKNYQGLLEWKNLMLAMRNDIRYREVFPRQYYNRIYKSQNQVEQVDLFNTDDSTKVLNHFETFKRADYEYAPGGMTLEGRRLLLEHLLYIEQRDGHSLIAEEEIEAILDQWEDTEGIRIPRTEIQPKPFTYDGELVFLPDKSINHKKTKSKNKVFYFTIELNKEDFELYLFMKERQKVNQTSLFYFPARQEFKDKKLVWNKATFVVCREGISTKMAASEYLFNWLGWTYGHFTKETHKAAINHLILSALSDGFAEQKQKKVNSVSSLEMIELTSDDEQMAFAI
jgi:DNA sulfur modification protein DndC